MVRPSYAEGWFYMLNGDKCGPVSEIQLWELVTSGQIQPRQAVWMQSTLDQLFICAGTVVFGTESESLDFG